MMTVSAPALNDVAALLQIIADPKAAQERLDQIKAAQLAFEDQVKAQAEREKDLRSREAALKVGLNELDRKRTDHDDREQAIADKEAALTNQENALKKRGADQDKAYVSRLAAVGADKKATDERAKKLAERVDELDARTKELDAREETVGKREVALESAIAAHEERVKRISMAMA